MVIIIQNGVNEESVIGAIEIAGAGINDEKYYKCQDFDEETAAVTLAAGLRGDEFLTGGLNDAAANATYIQGEGGVLQINTNGLDNDSHEFTWLNTALAINSNPILEFRVQVDVITASNLGFFVGVTETPDIQAIGDISAVSDDYFVVGMNSDLGTPALLRAYSEDNNGGQVLNEITGFSMAANTWTTIRIDLSDTEQPRVWINLTGGSIKHSDEIPAALIATNTVQAGIFVYPVIFINSVDVGNSVATLLIDYIKIWQTRS